jgi:CHAD domain-containing protein
MSRSRPPQDCDPWVGLVRHDLQAVLRRAALCVRELPLTPGNVHRARRCFKEAAALLRLLAEIDATRAAALVALVRGFRRQLGAARDLDVVEQTFAPFAAALPPEIGASVHRKLEIAKRDMTEDQTSASAGGIGRGVRELSFEISQWDLGGADASSLIATLRNSYRNARRRGKKAVETIDPTDLHEFRKSSIVFREQLAVFRPAWPKLVDAWCAEAQSLRNLLGRLNDLALLAAFSEDLESSGAAQLADAIAAARSQASRLVEPASRRLFSERPGRMSERVESWIGSPKKSPVASLADPPQEAAKTRP